MDVSQSLSFLINLNSDAIARFTLTKKSQQDFKLKVMINSGILSCGKEPNDMPQGLVLGPALSSLMICK